MSDIKGIEVKDLLGLSQPLTKLVEVAERGAGVIYAPFHEKRMAKATAEKIRIIADACQNSLQFPLNYNDAEGLEISTNLSAQELCRRTIARKIFQEMNKQQNIEEVLEHAKNILEQEKEVSKEPVSQTWLSNFFEAAGNVEEEDLQKIWGKLLAGEIKKPSSYNLRTLSILKNMSSSEAICFQRISSFVVRFGRNYIIPRIDSLENKYKIKYEDMMLLEECGVLTTGPFLQLTINLEDKKKPLFNNRLVAVLQSNNTKFKSFATKIYALTSAGIDIFNIIEQDPNNDFFKEYIQNLKLTNSNLLAPIYKHTGIKNENGQDVFKLSELELVQ